jgi:aminopeptidase C
MEKELPLLGKIRKQCGGTCWLHASLVAQEHRISDRIGSETPLSIEHLVVAATMDRFKNAVVNGLKGREEVIPEVHVQNRLNRPLTQEEIDRLIVETSVSPSADSGSVGEFVKLAQLYGTIPKDAFEFGREPLDWGVLRARVLDAAKFHHLRYRELATEAEKAAYLSKAEAWMQNFLKLHVGRSPESFLFEGREYSPKEFFKAFDYAADAPIKNYFSTAHYMKPDRPPTPNQTSKLLPPTEMIQLIRHQIDRGFAVYGGFLWSRFMLNVAGVMLVQESRPAGSGGSHGKHAVAITGYALDQNGEVSAFKLQNSWGERRGNRGFYVIGIEEFKRAIRNIQIVEEGA